MDKGILRFLLVFSLIAVILSACGSSGTSTEADSAVQTVPVEEPAEGNQDGDEEGMVEMEVPDLTAAATTLGVTEDALKEALGDPSQGEPDLEAAAESLGVTADELRSAMGISEQSVEVDAYTVTFNGIEFDIAYELFSWADLPSDVVYERQPGSVTLPNDDPGSRA